MASTAVSQLKIPAKTHNYGLPETSCQPVHRGVRAQAARKKHSTPPAPSTS